MKSRYLFALLMMGCTLLPALPARAQYRIIDPISPILMRQGQEALWRSYTPRQRQIATAIGQLVNNHYNRTKQPVPLTQANVNYAMRYVGANASERNFVIDRIQANNQALSALIDLEDEIQRTEELLNSF